MKPTHLLALALAACAAALPSPASACSGYLQCRTLGTTYPADDATNIPLNTELRITYTGARELEAGASATLETDDGTLVPTTWERAQLFNAGPTQQWVGRAALPLEASTHYRLRHSFTACGQTDAGASPFETCVGLCQVERGDVISEFTTGTTAYDGLPEVLSLGVPAEAAFDSCDKSACCGPYARCLRTIDVPERPVGQTLRITRGGELIGYFPADRDLRVASQAAGSNGWAGDVDFSGAGTYTLSVVDKNGNRSPETTFWVPDCYAPSDSGVPDSRVQADGSVPARQDASTPTTLDARVPDPDASSDAGSRAQPSKAADGCALAGGHSSWTSGLWSALAMLLARRRQRTSR